MDLTIIQNNLLLQELQSLLAFFSKCDFFIDILGDSVFLKNVKEIRLYDCAVYKKDPYWRFRIEFGISVATYNYLRHEHVKHAPYTQWEGSLFIKNGVSVPCKTLALGKDYMALVVEIGSMKSVPKKEIKKIDLETEVILFDF